MNLIRGFVGILDFLTGSYHHRPLFDFKINNMEDFFEDLKTESITKFFRRIWLW